MGVPDRFRPKPSYTSIVGISSTVRMPRLGKIRLGIKVKNAKGVEYPKDLDYFVCPPEVQAIYGEQPKEILVLIPAADPALYFPQALKWYKGARLICKGNGETATRIDEKTGNMFEMGCPCEQLRDSQKNPKGPCTPRASLMLILPKVSMGGAYQMDTGSMNNIININSTLKWIESMLGRVAWVPLILKRTPQKIQTPDGTTTKCLVSLEFTGNARDAANLRKMDWIAIQGGTVPAALPPHVVDDDGPGDVEGDVIDEATGEIIENGKKTAPATEKAAEDPPGETISTPVDTPVPEKTVTAKAYVAGTEPEKGPPPYQEPPKVEREPGADEGEDEVPFPEPESPPPDAAKGPKSEVQVLVEGRTLLLSSAGTKPILEAVWAEIVKDRRIPNPDKATLQAIYDRKKKEVR